jgi:hypothetical protein
MQPKKEHGHAARASADPFVLGYDRNAEVEKRNLPPKAIVSPSIHTAVQKDIPIAVDHANPTQSRLYAHICPICGRKHVVNALRHRFAYGKQLACSFECDIARRRAMGSLFGMPCARSVCFKFQKTS